MKKVIYGMIILVGGLLIASNFNVDSSKIDHKKVSASGTACKWISESGYAVGPHYVVNSGVTDSTGYQLSEPDFKLLPCSTSNSGTEKDGNLFYADSTSNSLYNGYLGRRYDISSPSITSRKRTLFYIENGKITKFYETTNSSIQITDSRLEEVSEEKNFFNKYYVYMDPSSNVVNNIVLDYPNSSGEWMFTCVCAEY